MTALYLERYLNFGLTRAELQSGRPIIGIAQTGSDLVPCNRHHLELAERVRAGVRDAGGIPLEFPVHPLQETGKRPTAALDRNLAYLGLVEILYGYPLDGVVLTTGCDKTVPACLMAAATVNLPAIVLSGGPMLNGYVDGRRAGSGVIIWQSRRLLAAGRIDYTEFMDRVSRSAPSVGHCNTMGTALSMNSIAEALGMTLPGCAAIPAPYRERGQVAYDTGRRAVQLVRENVTPRAIMSPDAFENAIMVASAIAGSTNCPIHVNAIARHCGIELTNSDWERVGGDIPILANCAPAGDYLGEDFHHAGGVPAIMHALLAAGRLHGDAMTVNGRTIGANVADTTSANLDVIADYDKPFGPRGGVLVLHGNLFSSGMMKMSVITEDLRARYLTSPVVTWRAVVFDGPEDYHDRIDDPDLEIDENCVLVVRYAGNIAYPGSAEVVNMQPPTALIMRGVDAIPTLGDGRQSGTADAPSILNVSPEAAVGGNLAILRTGDRITLDIPNHRLDVDLTDEEITARWRDYTRPSFTHQTPWQELFRAHTGRWTPGAAWTSPSPIRTSLPPRDSLVTHTNRGTIMIADSDFGDVDVERAIVEDAGFRLSAHQCKSERDVIAHGYDAEGILTQYAHIGATAMDQLPHLRVISRYGTGVDIVDVHEATRHGIQVTNAPNDWCADEVADHAIALWLAAARKITLYDAATRRGEWQWQTGEPIWRLRGRVFGLLGYGAIARLIAARARAFGVEVWAHDPFVDATQLRADGVRSVTLDELVSGSDYLTIQAPLTPDTRHLFDDTMLARMKPTAILINTARGPIIEDAALDRALRQGTIAAAALDDLEEEPGKQHGWQPRNPLLRNPNVIVTPHAAYYSEQSVQAIRAIAATEAVRVLSGQPPRSPVNHLQQGRA